MKTLALAMLVTLVGCDSKQATPAPASAPSVTTPSAAVSVATTPPTPASAAPLPDVGPAFTLKEVLFPGSGAMSLDYIAYERAGDRVWIPSARDNGGVDVYDIKKGVFTHIEGFKIDVKESDGKKRTSGPSAVDAGDGYAYVGNRGTREICPVDAKTLKVGACLTMTSPTDAVVYVAPAKEVWVTSPKDGTLLVLDASRPDTLRLKAPIKVDGQPEGYVVDAGRGLFYTNLEDKNRTLAVDIKTHTVKSSWAAGCGPSGPRGLALDAAKNLLFVACTDHVRVLDAAHDGAFVSKIETGEGVDNIDYLPAGRLLYAAAGKSGRLTIARIDEAGHPTVIASGPTAARARNAVVDTRGNVYLVDPSTPRLLVIAAPK